MTCLTSHSLRKTEPGFEPRRAGAQTCVLSGSAARPLVPNTTHWGSPWQPPLKHLAPAGHSLLLHIVSSPSFWDTTLAQSYVPFRLLSDASTGFSHGHRGAQNWVPPPLLQLYSLPSHLM